MLWIHLILIGVSFELLHCLYPFLINLRLKIAKLELNEKNILFLTVLENTKLAVGFWSYFLNFEFSGFLNSPQKYTVKQFSIERQLFLILVD